LKIFYDHGDIIRLWCPSPGLYIKISLMFLF